MWFRRSRFGGCSRMEAEVFKLLLDYLRLAAAWVVFWTFFFTRFPVLRGWTLADVMTLWAVVTAGFGLAFGIMGNAHQLAPAIAQGELDSWLSHPRAVLPHLL